MPKNSRNTVCKNAVNGNPHSFVSKCFGGLCHGPHALGALLGRLAPSRKHKGFTLMELLVVISVLAVLATVLLPFGASLIDYTKREKTIQVLDSLRFALVGAENNYDENGNRILGGYVGEFDALPDLITHWWDNTNQEWDIQYKNTGNSAAPENLPYVYDEDLEDDYTYVTDGTAQTELYDDSKYNRDKFNQNAMPLALWTNFVKVGDSYQTIVDKDVWQGPYVVREADDVTIDDSLYFYDDGAGFVESPANKLSIDEIDENRRFWLRQGGGRLLDGWGSALLFYMDNGDLYAVSAGSDRQINYGEYYLDTANNDYDNGPADLSLSGNEDNLVMFLSKKQWDLTSQKTRMTQIKLKDLKTAILGKRGNMTGGVQQPNGFIADIGNLETLVGSYVYETDSSDTKVYKAKHKHTSSSSYSLTNTTYWEEITTDDSSTTDTETVATDYPFAYKWSSTYPSTHYPSQPSLLVTNADYVKVTSTTDSDDVTYYRYINDEDESGKDPASNTAYWVEDDTFAGHDWVLEYDSSTTYTSEILPSWTYYSVVEFGTGWSGPYMTNTTDPLTDAWGRQIVLEMDKGNLIIRSRGPQVYKDGSTSEYYEDDDITETIVRTDYAVPATVLVKSAEAQTDSDGTITTAAVTPSDSSLNYRRVAIYFPRNGSIGFSIIYINDGNKGDGDDGEFLFTRSYTYSYGLQTDINQDSSGEDTILYMPTIKNLWLQSSATNAENNVSEQIHNGEWIPVTKVMVAYLTSGYYFSVTSSYTINYSPASPHPTTYTGTNNTGYPGPLGYQKSFLIQPRTNPTLVLGE